VPPIQGAALEELASKLGGGWNIVEAHHLEKTFTFKDFAEALAFTNKVGDLAEAQNHHPDIHLSWGKVKVLIWTHKIDGLTESDFIFAAKTEALYVSRSHDG
jgi:4a-hydroxytetrahydrobiopterin dehydratase